MNYTAESGVRNLERAIGSVCRSVAYDLAVLPEGQQFKQVTVSKKLIEEALGTKKFDHLL